MGLIPGPGTSACCWQGQREREGEKGKPTLLLIIFFLYLVTISPWTLSSSWVFFAFQSHKYLNILVNSESICWSSHCGSAKMNLTSIHEDTGLIPGLVQWVKDLRLLWAAGYVGWRCGSDPVLLWLWCRSAAAALIQPLAREPSYASSATLKKERKKKWVNLLWFKSQVWYVMIVSPSVLSSIKRK